MTALCEPALAPPSPLSPHLVDVACVEADGVTALGALVAEGEELVGHLGGARELTGTREAQQQQVQDETLSEG